MDSMRRRKFVKATGGAALITGLAGCSGDDNDDTGNGGGNGTTNLEVATAAEGTGSATFASGAARIADQHSDGFSLSVTNYPGTSAIMEIFGNNEADLMTADSVNAVLAANDMNPVEGIDYSGDEALEHKPTQVFSLFPLWYFWVTLQDNGYDTIEDAAGETWGVGEAGSAPVFRLRLEESGFTDYEYETADFTEHPGALREGRVEAIPHYMLPPNISPGWAEELVSMDNLQILPYTDEQKQNLEDSEIIQVDEIDVSEMYEHDVPGSDNVTVSASYIYFAANAGIGDDVIYELCETMFDNLDEVKDFHVLLDAAFDPESSIESMSEAIPVHPGAAEWYQDNDLWRDELEIA